MVAPVVPTPRVLATEIIKRGFTFRQVWREESLAIYSQSQNNLPAERGPLGFEVIIIKVAPAGEIMGREIPEREVYPSSDSWGTHGWTMGTFEDALAKARKIVEAA